MPVIPEQSSTASSWICTCQFVSSDPRDTEIAHANRWLAVDGEGAARYIKSTNNKNSATPIIAVSAYSGVEATEDRDVFAAYIAKPLQKSDLVAVMRQLGFKTSTAQGRSQGATRLTSVR